MKSLDDYIKVLTNPTPTEEDEQTRDLLMGFIANCYEYIEFISENTLNFLLRLNTTIESLRSIPNAYFESTIKQWEQITLAHSKMERRDLEERQKEEKVQKLSLSKQKKDGFTNASILIYIAMNLGLFLACLLLLFK